MSKTRRNNYKGKGKYPKGNNGTPRVAKSGKDNINNLQDRNEKREYDKGFRAGANSPVPTGTSDNDSSWYIPTNILANDVAQFPFGISTGLPLDIKSGYVENPSPFIDVKKDAETLPGILVLSVIPSVGDTDGPTAPINLAGSQQYTAMQILSSRNPLYNNGDMIIFQVAVAQLYSFYSWMCRVYGTLKNYSALNRYTPQALVTAMGVDFSDIVKHQADFRAYINTFAYQLASFYLPNDVKYVARQVFLYENIYMDSSNAKAQYYMYNPIGFYQMIEGEINQDRAVPTYLKLTALGKSIDDPQVGALSSYDDIIAYGESLINPVRQSEDVRIMTADLIKAYGLGNTFTVNPIAETYTVTPVYNPEVLSQFENAYICPHADAVTARIVQNTELNNDTVSQSIACSISSGQFDFRQAEQWGENHGTPEDMHFLTAQVVLNSLIPQNFTLNFHKDVVTAEDVLVASRLSRCPFSGYTVSPTTGATKFSVGYEVTSGGTEVISGAWLWYYNENHELEMDPIQTTSGVLGGLVSSSGRNVAQRLLDHIRKISRLESFDWHPKTQFFANDYGTQYYPVNLTQFGYDYDNFTIITNEEWDRMNRVALLGLFQCSLGDTPRMSK